MSATASMTDRPMHAAGGKGAGAVHPERLALSAGEVEHFHQEGYLVVEGVVTGAALDELRAVTDGFLDRARELEASDGPIDLSPDHTREDPQVRRIIDPDRHHPTYGAASRMPEVLDVVCDLLGPDIRFDHSKLNCKPPGGGVPIEWHQDWAFYPQTNDSMLALSLMLDDCDLGNGPLLVIPGSHKGPTWDHHYEGRFIGAIDPAAAGFDESSAVALVGPAGSVAIHHVRTVHGSADSVSGRQRRLLNMNYATTSTWPLLGLDTVLAMHEPGIEGFHATTVRGSATFEPRMESLPVRIPLPSADVKARTIFDLQMPAYGRSSLETAPRAASVGGSRRRDATRASAQRCSARPDIEDLPVISERLGVGAP